MSDSLNNKKFPQYVLFPDKTSNSNISDNNDYYLTANNINDIKNAINSSISKIVELENSLSSNIIPKISSLNSYVNNFDQNIKFIDLASNDLKLSSAIDSISGYFYNFTKNIENVGNDIKNIKNEVDKHDKDIEQYVSGLSVTISNFALELNNIKTNLSNLKFASNILLSSNTNFEEKINKIEMTNSVQNSKLKTNTNDLKNVKETLEHHANILSNLNSTQNINLNKIILENSNILYYTKQIDERIILQDARCDHLERLISGLQEPADWDDWNLLFRLLNMLKLKISKLSITNKVPINETIISNDDISEFGFILREIENKLKRLPYDQIVETGIKTDEILNILNSLDSIQSVDPNTFEFYPLYPVVTEPPEDWDIPQD